MNGLALTILVGQLPKLFGFSVDADGLIAEAAGVRPRAGRRRDGAGARSPSALLGLVVILVLQRWLPKVPGRAGRGRRWRSRPPAVFDLGERGVDAGRRAAAGLPAVHPPARRPGRTSRCCSSGRSGITLVSLTDTISTASAFAARTGQEVAATRR